MALNERSTDEELMQAYQNGDVVAFDLLFKRHSSRVYGFLMKKLKNRSRADDVFQSTFLKLHQARRHYDPSFPFAPWLFTVCKSVLTDDFRKHDRRREDVNDDLISRTADPKSVSGSQAFEIDLAGLSGVQKAALKLRYHDELRFDEIAVRLMTSPSNVRQLISRGLEKLRARGSKKGERS